VIRVPGSAELLGGPTEPHDGLVFSVAVDRAVEFAFVPRTDGRIELVSERPDRRVKLWPRECEPGGGPGWATPVMAAVRQLRSIGGTVRGFNAGWTSTIPQGAGFGEHAALVVAAALGLRRLFPFALADVGLGPAPTADGSGELPRLGLKECARFAAFCLEAERGIQAGEDRAHAFVAPLANQAYGASQLDCLHWRIERYPLPGQCALVFCDTGIRDACRGLHWSRFVATGRRAAAGLGLGRLRSLAADEVARRTASLPSAERGAVRFVTGECARVVAAEEAMRRGDVTQLGECVFQSHAAARAEAGLTVSEVDLLVEAAREHPACVGARFTGSGCDGGTLNLVSATQLDSFESFVGARFRDATGREPTFLRLRPEAGVFG
jgi:galactokinase